MTKWLYALAFLLMSASAPAAHAQTPAAQGPSFSCAGAKDIDATVCQDATLSADDRRLTALYAAVRSDVFGTGPSQQLVDQRAWLAGRNKTCAATAFKPTYKTQRDCLIDSYNSRLGDLAAAALFTAHDAAMAEIRRLTPADAPIYEAIYLYGTIDDPKARAARVAQTITPVFAAYTADQKSEITGGGGPATPAEAVKSDEAFGHFVDLSVSEAEHAVTWPCAVFLKRPGLLGALGPMYGSNKDNFLPSSDCDVMTPGGTDGFTTFVVTAMQNAPDCGGTIRNAGARDFQRMRIAALLHHPEQWATFKANAPDKPEKTFRARNAAGMAKARTILAGYYAQTLHLDAATANRDAGKITDVLISQAYDLCED